VCSLSGDFHGERNPRRGRETNKRRPRTKQNERQQQATRTLLWQCVRVCVCWEGRGCATTDSQKAGAGRDNLQGEDVNLVLFSLSHCATGVWPRNFVQARNNPAEGVLCFAFMCFLHSGRVLFFFSFFFVSVWIPPEHLETSKKHLPPFAEKGQGKRNSPARLRGPIDTRCPP
jgi:hypothetical protein